MPRMTSLVMGFVLGVYRFDLLAFRPHSDCYMFRSGRTHTKRLAGGIRTKDSVAFEQQPRSLRVRVMMPAVRSIALTMMTSVASSL